MLASRFYLIDWPNSVSVSNLPQHGINKILKIEFSY